MITLQRRVFVGFGSLAAGYALLGRGVVQPNAAWAFADDGAFHPRLLQTGEDREDLDGARRAASHWSLELMRRTSAPGRLVVDSVRPSSPQLLEEPTLVWQGSAAVEPLSATEVRQLRQYLRMGGMLVVDDRAPQSAAFGSSVKRELRRVLPSSQPVVLPDSHVLYKTFYLLPTPMGRVAGPEQLEAITSKQAIRVLFLRHDLMGALEPSLDGRGWARPVLPGGAFQREQALRLAVNIAMYVLCSDYKDDQVHAPFLMRRRQRER